jgi:hypothetical protein
MTWTIGSALRTTFVLVRDNFFAFFVTTLVVTTPLLVVDILEGGIVVSLAAGLLSNVLTAICLTVGTLQAMAGHRPDAAGLLRQIGRPNSGRLILLGIVQSLVIALGFMLVIPGIWVLALWMVATPAMVVDDLSVGAALDRSAALTRDRRWRTLGAFGACLVIAIVPLTIINYLAVELAGGTEGSLTEHVVMWLVGAVLGAVMGCLPTVLYALLLQEKDGTTIAQLAVDRG